MLTAGLLLAATCSLQFPAVRVYEAPVFASGARVEIADLDGDGHPDVLVSDARSYIRYGNVRGELAEAAVVDAIGLAAADVNGDALPDLIATDRVEGFTRIGVTLNRGGRQFAPPRELFPGFGSVVAGDFTNDGAPDVLVARRDEQPAFLLNDGRGGFSLQWGSAPALTAFDYPPHRMVKGDFNGDGNLDVAAPSHQLQVFLGNGRGHFTATPLSDTEHLPIAAVDLDGDGRDELAMIQPEETVDWVRVYDTTTTAKRFEVRLPRTWGYYLNAADMNGDGRDDLVVTKSGSINNLPHTFEPLPDGHIDVYPGAGNGSFGAPQRLLAGMPLLEPRRGDFNGDGLDDLAAGTYDRGLYVVFGGGGVAELLPRNRDHHGTTEISVGDLDDDGFDDLAAVPADDNLRLFTGSAAGLVDRRAFMAASEYATPLIVRLAAGQPRAILMRDEEPDRPRFAVLQPVCAPQRRRGVRH